MCVLLEKCAIFLLWPILRGLLGYQNINNSFCKIPSEDLASGHLHGEIQSLKKKRKTATRISMQEDHTACNPFPERREISIVCQGRRPSNTSSLGVRQKLIHGVMRFHFISLCCQTATKPIHLLWVAQHKS